MPCAGAWLVPLPFRLPFGLSPFFAPEVAARVQELTTNPLETEQYMDFLRNRMFRQTLLCHTHQKPDYALRPDAVMQFHIASNAKPASANPDIASSAPEQFKGPGEPTLTTRDPDRSGHAGHVGDANAAAWSNDLADTGPDPYARAEIVRSRDADPVRESIGGDLTRVL